MRARGLFPAALHLVYVCDEAGARDGARLDALLASGVTSGCAPRRLRAAR
jgi:hypothetical protein